MKKSLIFWFAAVTCAALFLVGCESPTNGESGAAGSPGPATLPPDAKPELLAAYFASTDKVFLVANLDTGTFVVPAGKTLAVVGDVTLNNSSVINAYAGNFDVSAGSIGGANAVFIVRNPSDYDATEITSGTIPAYAAGVSGTPITEDTVLPSLTLGGTGGTTAAAFTAFAGGNTVYVAGDLAIDAATALSTDTAKLVVLGETTAAGAGGITFGANTKIGTLKATGALKITAVGAGGVEKLDLNGNTVTITAADNIGVITSGAADGSIILPVDGAIGDITVGAYDIAIGGTPAAVTVAELAASGAGKLILPAAAISFTATAGGGKIAYAADPASVTLSSTTGLTYVGDLTVAGAVSVTGPLTVDGEADFGGSVGLEEAYFAADVTLADGSVVTLTSDEPVTLEAAGAIKAGANLLLGAGSSNAVLTPGGAATLTVDEDNKKLTLGAYPLTLTSGHLAVSSGAKLVLDKVLTVAAGAVLGVQGEVSVTITDGGLTLTAAEADGGAKLSGYGKVTAGSTEIVGPWQAVGTGTIAITYATTITTITGAATNALTASTATLSDNPVITQKAGTSNNSLTLAANTTVALGGDTTTALGKIVLDANTSPGKLSLDSTSKVLIGAGTGGNNASAISAITIGGKSVTSTTFVVADYKVVGSGPYNLVQIGGTTGGTLTAGTDDANDVPIASNSAFTGS